MSDDPPRKPDPAALARGGQPRALPKRFYAEATAAPRGDGHAVHLDGRPLRTPGKLVLDPADRGARRRDRRRMGAPRRITSIR